MKKKIRLIVIIIVTIVVLLFTYFKINDIKQEKILKQEIVNLTNKNLTTDEFEIEIKTSGNYAYIEESIKRYYQELSNLVKKTNTLMKNENLINIISPKNLDQDDENLSKSFEIINKTKQEMKDTLNKIVELCKEEKILSLVDNKKIGNNYYDLYKELMYKKEDLKKLEEVRKEVERLSTALDNFFDKILEVLEFLKINKGEWLIKEDELYFKQNKHVESYNKLLEDIKDLTSEMENKKDSTL